MKYRFLSERPTLKLLSPKGHEIEFTPYYTTQDEGDAALLRTYSWIYELDPDTGSTDAVPDSVMLRDINGRGRVKKPAHEEDIANKAYVDVSLAGFIPDLSSVWQRCNSIEAAAQAATRPADSSVMGTVTLAVREKLAQKIEDSSVVTTQAIKPTLDRLDELAQWSAEAGDELAGLGVHMQAAEAELDNINGRIDAVVNDGTPDATETVKGKSARASEADVDTGTDDAKYLSVAKGMRLVGNTRPFATTAEALAGILNDKTLTPLRLAEAMGQFGLWNKANIKTLSEAKHGLWWVPFEAAGNPFPGTSGAMVEFGYPFSGMSSIQVVFSASGGIAVRIGNGTSFPEAWTYPLAEAMAQFGLWGSRPIPDPAEVPTYNSMYNNGFYLMRSTDQSTGAPNFGEVCYLMSMRLSDTWSMQFVVSVNSAKSATRIQNNGVWGAWVYLNDASSIMSGMLGNERSPRCSFDSEWAAPLSGGVLTLDCNYGAQWFIASSNITSIVFNNRPPISKRSVFTLEIIGDGTSRTINWGTTRWTGGTAPTLDFRSGRTNYITFEVLPAGYWIFGSATAIGALTL